MGAQSENLPPKNPRFLPIFAASGVLRFCLTSIFPFFLILQTPFYLFHFILVVQFLKIIFPVLFLISNFTSVLVFYPSLLFFPTLLFFPPTPLLLPTLFFLQSLWIQRHLLNNVLNQQIYVLNNTRYCGCWYLFPSLPPSLP